ncbi:hypothetical protein C7974DRAFT_391192 [Boeremia exigua]|uniref:uncharacterized protein n=1 Tax=Boeremia exigua TaxID=749465 RepID=UPI001E8D308A|nr:uncharacterized protein C7974DRAFT_391192 [Boeremia exigua]KAH6638269.1 hypothetical protein C7974DRAFT_391192 [Boeremia exigua]
MPLGDPLKPCTSHPDAQKGMCGERGLLDPSCTHPVAQFPYFRISWRLQLPVSPSVSGLTPSISSVVAIMSHAAHPFLHLDVLWSPSILTSGTTRKCGYQMLLTTICYCNPMMVSGIPPFEDTVISGTMPERLWSMPSSFHPKCGHHHRIFTILQSYLQTRVFGVCRRRAKLRQHRLRNSFFSNLLRFRTFPACDPYVSTCIVEGTGATLARDAHRKRFACSPTARLISSFVLLEGEYRLVLALMCADPTPFGYCLCTSHPFDEVKRNNSRIILRSTMLSIGSGTKRDATPRKDLRPLTVGFCLL